MNKHKINCSFEFGNPEIYNNLGSTPALLVDLCSWLREKKEAISSIDIALYLFNNEYLYTTLKLLADSGCRVRVYSIPLEGYDMTPHEITDHKTNKLIGTYSKFDLARSLYNKIKTLNHPGFSLLIMPHMCIRSSNVAPFSRGKMPYSLHSKSYLVQFRNGTAYAGLSSSNFAVRDAQKIELACIMPLGEDEKTASADFYQGLYENSIPVNQFKEDADYSHYKIKTRAVPAASQTRYIAPFYKNSAIDFENTLIDLIKNAKKQIIIAAQHIASYNYYCPDQTKKGYSQKEGFLKHVLDKASAGIPAVFISQTYADDKFRSDVRRPQNTKAFIEFALAARKTKNCQYYVNSDMHAKYIIIDDTVILTTCNLTPTQFIYLPQVNITHFKQIPNAAYSGIFCEHGAYFITENPDTCRLLSGYTKDIIDLQNTQKVI